MRCRHHVGMAASAASVPQASLFHGADRRSTVLVVAAPVAIRAVGDL